MRKCCSNMSLLSLWAGWALHLNGGAHFSPFFPLTSCGERTRRLLISVWSHVRVVDSKHNCWPRTLPTVSKGSTQRSGSIDDKIAPHMIYHECGPQALICQLYFLINSYGGLHNTSLNYPGYWPWLVCLDWSQSHTSWLGLSFPQILSLSVFVRTRGIYIT